MRLDVGDLGAGRAAERIQRAELIQHHGLHLVRRTAHVPAAEAGEVGIGRMRADADAMLHRQAHGALHDQRIAGMEAAGQVGLVDQRHGVDIVAHLPGAEAFAHVAVEEDSGSHAWKLKAGSPEREAERSPGWSRGRGHGPLLQVRFRVGATVSRHGQSLV
ncbi:hypothetical protein D9M71_634500 [compost metagenome]